MQTVYYRAATRTLENQMYNYVRATPSGKRLGLTSIGSFSGDRSHWIVFSEAERDAIGSKRPYGSTMYGYFERAR